MPSVTCVEILSLTSLYFSVLHFSVYKMEIIIVTTAKHYWDFSELIEVNCFLSFNSVVSTGKCNIILILFLLLELGGNLSKTHSV